MYNILLHTHSGLRWLVLIALIAALFQTFSRRGSTGSIMETKSVLFTFILTHLQLLVGLILYFISPKVIFGSDTMSNSMLRFFTVEHALGMIIAIVLITLGYSKAKKAELPFNKAFNYYIAAFIIMMASIPWPFRALGAGWF
jgi:hypothetical protein